LQDAEGERGIREWKDRGNGERQSRRRGNGERERSRELTCASRDIASSGMDSPAPSAARSANIFSAANTMPVRRSEVGERDIKTD
jgi:hypothetical protein